MQKCRAVLLEISAVYHAFPGAEMPPFVPKLAENSRRAIARNIARHNCVVKYTGASLGCNFLTYDKTNCVLGNFLL